MGGKINKSAENQLDKIIIAMTKYRYSKYDLNACLCYNRSFEIIYFNDWI